MRRMEDGNRKRDAFRLRPAAAGQRRDEPASQVGKRQGRKREAVIRDE